MSTRYLTEFTCCTETGVTNAKINQWMEDVMRQVRYFISFTFKYSFLISYLKTVARK